MLQKRDILQNIKISKAKFRLQAKKSRTEWMLEFQGMVILIANQIWWTVEVEEVFRKIADGEKRAMIEVHSYSSCLYSKA